MKDIIIEAGQNLRTLKIDYEKADGTRGWREIEPYSLKDVNGMETLFAKNAGQPGIRSFKLDFIHQVEITENTFDPEWEVKF